MCDNNGSGKTLCGLTAGFAVGILVGAFLTSDKCKSAREQLSDTIKKTGDEAYKKFAGIVSDVKDKIKTSKINVCDTDIDPI
ncbi:MAG: hypothetical protein ACQPRJ_05690 [Solitalea-like symbiont of Acarus siro]